MSRVSLLLIQTSRWNLAEMQEYFAQRDLSASNKEMARECCLGKEVKLSGLATLKDFLQFQAVRK